MNPTNSLYADRADLYAIIADDRDFLGEVRRMGALLLGEGSRFVELFAGPAYHSRALLREGWSGAVEAIDTSPQMAALARAAGYSGRYDCDDAIKGLEKLDSADIICIPRFSIVLVDADYARRLFVAIRRVMRDATRLFVEVHPDTAKETAWRSLPIRERRVRRDSLEVVCEWPQSVREVPDVAGAVDMTVRVSVTDGSGPSEEHIFVSREYLHTKTELILWAEAAGLALDPPRSFLTASGEFLAFATGTGMVTPPRVSTELLQAAFTARFDLSSERARESAILLSGLDIAKHDSPLSRHVYNLL